MIPGVRPVPEGAASMVGPIADAGPAGGFLRDGEPLPW